MTRLASIGSVTLGVFAISIAPFLAQGMDQGKQLLSRLFPFTRGLMHAYWAPKWVSKPRIAFEGFSTDPLVPDSVWALAAISDRVLLKRG